MQSDKSVSTANPLADELASSRYAKPCVLVIFGATGDLTSRKLVPALMSLAQDGLLPSNFVVVGFARSARTDQEFIAELVEGVRCYGLGEDACVSLARRILFHQSNYDNVDGYRKLAERLTEVDAKYGTAGNRLYYLATPPSAYTPILDCLGESGLSKPADGSFARVVIEKPVGHNLASAQALNGNISRSFREKQVFRIDHYLGKETVQNILAMRFANHIFEPLWNEKFVDHVQITVAESIGIGSRGGYFEQAGILRDMIQNHLLQVLTLVAMEPPVSLHADAVRDEKVKVLRAIRSFEPEEVDAATVRGQYVAAYVDNERVNGYRDEEGVARDSGVETYAAVRLAIHNWRWANTPFFLRSAKRMPRRTSEVAIHFKQPPYHLFDSNDRGAQQNVLLLQIQPDEGISLRFGSKVPGPNVKLRDVRMDFRYGTAFGESSPEAYERLLLDAMVGDPTLFARRDEVEEAWRIVDSIATGWAQSSTPPLLYEAGSWGPERADELLGDGRTWRRP